MIKNSTIAILCLLFLACNNKVEQNTTESLSEDSKMSVEKTINREVEDTIDGGTMLLGLINRNGLKKEPYTDWYENSQNDHPLDTSLVKQIASLLDGVKLKVFMGTWCEDSQREVPALYKILDAADFNYDHLEVIAVSHDKDTPTGLEQGFDIEFVPTILFLKNGDTLNRIVEYAHGSLEQDMLTILRNEDYTPAYAD